MCPFRCGPVRLNLLSFFNRLCCTAYYNTRTVTATKNKGTREKRTFGWKISRMIKITSLFHEYVFFRSALRSSGWGSEIRRVWKHIVSVCMCVCTFVCVRACGFSFFRSHRANQQQRKKAFDLCSASYVVVLFLWFWLSVFIFVHGLLLLLLFYIFAPLLLFSFFHCSIHRALSNILRTHTRTRVLNAWFYVYYDLFFSVFFSISSLCHGISEKYKFHFIFRLDFNRKDKRIGKTVFSLFCFTRSTHICNAHTGVKQFNATESIYWALSLKPFNLFLLWILDRSNWKITFRG